MSRLSRFALDLGVLDVLFSELEGREVDVKMSLLDEQYEQCYKIESKGLRIYTNYEWMYSLFPIVPILRHSVVREWRLMVDFLLDWTGNLEQKPFSNMYIPEYFTMEQAKAIVQRAFLSPDPRVPPTNMLTYNTTSTYKLEWKIQGDVCYIPREYSVDKDYNSLLVLRRLFIEDVERGKFDSEFKWYCLTFFDFRGYALPYGAKDRCGVRFFPLRPGEDETEHLIEGYAAWCKSKRMFPTSPEFVSKVRLLLNECFVQYYLGHWRGKKDLIRIEPEPQEELAGRWYFIEARKYELVRACRFVVYYCAAPSVAAVLRIMNRSLEGEWDIELCWKTLELHCMLKYSLQYSGLAEIFQRFLFDENKDLISPQNEYIKEFFVYTWCGKRYFYRPVTTFEKIYRHFDNKPCLRLYAPWMAIEKALPWKAEDKYLRHWEYETPKLVIELQMANFLKNEFADFLPMAIFNLVVEYVQEPDPEEPDPE